MFEQDPMDIDQFEEQKFLWWWSFSATHVPTTIDEIHQNSFDVKSSETLVVVSNTFYFQPFKLGKIIQFD